MNTSTRLHCLRTCGPAVALLVTLLACATVSGQWNPTTPLPAPRWFPACCEYDGRLYATGGEQGGPQSAVWHSEIQPDGTLGNWVSTTSLPSGRMYHGCAAYDGYVYVIGGYGSGSYRTTVWSARILEDRSLGPWQTVTSLPSASSAFGALAWSGHLYLMGGYDGSADHRFVRYVPIEDSGRLGAWDSTVSLPAARRCPGACVYDGYLYVTGGFTWEHLPVAQNQVWYARVLPDGAIEPWETAAHLPAARYGHPCSAGDGRLLLTGGQTAFSYYRTVWHGSIGDSGVVDLWTATADLPETRTGHSSCTGNGYLYVIGGTNPSGNMSSVRYAEIDQLVGIASGTPAGIRASPVSLTLNPSIAGPGPVRIDCRIAGSDAIPVSLHLHDAAGRRVRTLVSERLTRGTHQFLWTPDRPGTWFLTLTTPDGTATAKAVVPTR